MTAPMTPNTQAEAGPDDRETAGLTDEARRAATHLLCRPLGAATPAEMGEHEATYIANVIDRLLAALADRERQLAEARARTEQAVKETCEHFLARVHQGNEREHALEEEIARLREALSRQGDNAAFLLNHCPMPEGIYRKLKGELEEDRRALSDAPAEPPMAAGPEYDAGDGDALRPCPFCGGPARVLPTDPKREGDAWGQVICLDEYDLCGVEGVRFYDDHDPKALAIEWWNKRVASPLSDADTAGLVEEARNMVRFPNTHFHYSDGPRVMGALADLVAALSSQPRGGASLPPISQDAIAEIINDHIEVTRADFLDSDPPHRVVKVNVIGGANEAARAILARLSGQKEQRE